MPKLNQRGVISQILVLLLLAAGLIGGLFLVQHPTFFKPKASGGNETRVEFVDLSGNTITISDSASVKVRLIYVAPQEGKLYKDISDQKIYLTENGILRELPDIVMAEAHGGASAIINKEHSVIEQWPIGKPFPVPTPTPTAIPTPSPTPQSINCRQFDHNIDNCVHQGGDDCAWYGCSDSCYPRGTSNQDAGCVQGVAYAQATSAYPTHFKIGKSAAELLSATAQPFTRSSLSGGQFGQELNWDLQSGNNSVFVKFIFNGEEKPVLSGSIVYTPPVSPSPSISPSPTSSSTPTHCGGNIQNAPQCPVGYSCDTTGFPPDVGGICVPIASPSPTRCGGIAGKSCPLGYQCQLDSDYPDAGGTCIYACLTPPACPTGTTLVHGDPKVGYCPVWVCTGPNPSSSPLPTPTATPAPTPDIDGDGQVTLSDVSLFIAKGGVDLDGNGVINSLDYKIMIKAWIDGGRKR